MEIGCGARVRDFDGRRYWYFWHYEREDGITRVLPAWLEERRHAEIGPEGVFRLVVEPSAARAVRRPVPA